MARERHLLAMIADLKRENAQLRLALTTSDAAAATTTPTITTATTTTTTMLNGLSNAPPKSLPVASTYTPPSLFAPLADPAWTRTIF